MMFFTETFLCPYLLKSYVFCFYSFQEIETIRPCAGLDIRLVDAVARGASIFENLLPPPPN